MVTKEQAAEFIRLMKQAIFSADSQVDNFSEPIANAMNVMLGQIDPNQDLLLDCGNAEETSDNNEITSDINEHSSNEYKTSEQISNDFSSYVDFKTNESPNDEKIYTNIDINIITIIEWIIHCLILIGIIILIILHFSNRCFHDDEDDYFQKP